MKTQKDNEKSSAYIKENLQPLLLDYHALLGMTFDQGMTAQKMLKLASNLPQFDDSQLFDELGITKRYHDLNTELEELRNQERDVLLKIGNISDASKTGAEFIEMLQELKDKTIISESDIEDYVCPLCGNSCTDISKNDTEILEATEWLDTELQMTNKYTADFSEDIRNLNEHHKNIEAKIKHVWGQIKNIERNFINSKSLVSKREQVNYAKTKIMLYTEMSNSGLFENVDQDINDLQDRIGILEKSIQAFDVKTKMAKAQTFLSDNMNRLAINLDFEDEYRPINLNFGLLDETFDIYQYQKKKEKIFLYEMGSGANWVSCHIALFLSFLRYFTMENDSPMPLIMFFDQPSQVYFPQGLTKSSEKGEFSQADLQAVNKMYKTIFDEINSIGKGTGILPQILIVDHVDGDGLEIKDEFMSYVRRDWRNGEALI
ncbi:DUF3732 domain-containing protein [Clostridium sp.]|uniref:DUF3732 domain-containing protein n=1 Tax=Clostridium sp. TaxID=1506 RepID=UPI002617CDF7|nr:DUF3732 domain-containing protein [Clostridium sp.]